MTNESNRGGDDMDCLNKEEIISMIAERAGLTKICSRRFLNAFTATIEQALVAGDGVRLIGFGNFKLEHRKAHRGRNPQNGKLITIPAYNRPAFKAGDTFKRAIKN